MGKNFFVILRASFQLMWEVLLEPTDYVHDLVEPRGWCSLPLELHCLFLQYRSGCVQVQLHCCVAVAVIADGGLFVAISDVDHYWLV